MLGRQKGFEGGLNGGRSVGGGGRLVSGLGKRR